LKKNISITLENYGIPYYNITILAGLVWQKIVERGFLFCTILKSKPSLRIHVKT